MNPRAAPVDRASDEPELDADGEPLHNYGADSGSSVSSASTWMGGEIDESWGIPEDILRTLPLHLCITNTVDQAAEFLPSQGEGHPQTARHIRTSQELYKLSKTVNTAWRSVKFRSMHFEPLLARVNEFFRGTGNREGTDPFHAQVSQSGCRHGS